MVSNCIVTRFQTFWYRYRTIRVNYWRYRITTCICCYTLRTDSYRTTIYCSSATVRVQYMVVIKYTWGCTSTRTCNYKAIWVNNHRWLCRYYRKGYRTISTSRWRCSCTQLISNCIVTRSQTFWYRYRTIRINCWRYRITTCICCYRLRTDSYRTAGYTMSVAVSIYYAVIIKYTWGSARTCTRYHKTIWCDYNSRCYITYYYRCCSAYTACWRCSRTNIVTNSIYSVRRCRWYRYYSCRWV